MSEVYQNFRNNWQADKVKTGQIYFPLVMHHIVNGLIVCDYMYSEMSDVLENGCAWCMGVIGASAFNYTNTLHTVMSAY